MAFNTPSVTGSKITEGKSDPNPLLLRERLVAGDAAADAPGSWGAGGGRVSTSSMLDCELGPRELRERLVAGEAAAGAPGYWGWNGGCVSTPSILDWEL